VKFFPKPHFTLSVQISGLNNACAYLSLSSATHQFSLRVCGDGSWLTQSSHLSTSEPVIGQQGSLTISPSNIYSVTIKTTSSDVRFSLSAAGNQPPPFPSDTAIESVSLALTQEGTNTCSSTQGCSVSYTGFVYTPAGG
jgi:hypothetical protein